MNKPLATHRVRELASSLVTTIAQADIDPHEKRRLLAAAHTLSGHADHAHNRLVAVLYALKDTDGGSRHGEDLYARAGMNSLDAA